MGRDLGNVVRKGKHAASIPPEGGSLHVNRSHQLPHGPLKAARKVGTDISVAMLGPDRCQKGRALFLPPSDSAAVRPDDGNIASHTRNLLLNSVRKSGLRICNDLVDICFDEERLLKKQGYRAYVVFPIDLPGWRDAAVLFASERERRFDAVTVGKLIGLLDETAAASVPEKNTDEHYYPQSEEKVIGESREFLEICRLLAIVARKDTTVLIEGDSGTGKELLAKTIHKYSRRADRPFVRVNCAAIAESLLESEMFGHRKGAFTGAIYSHKGRFEAANGGTLLLDEIGNMSLSGQAKLLRVLQEFEFEPVGQTSSVKVDVRIIATTNVDLKNAIRNGEFRQDLYYRLAVASIVIPPLKERRADIQPLAEYFLARALKRHLSRRTRLSKEVLDLLLQHDWPGNARELRNVIDYAVMVSRGSLIKVEDLPDTIQLLERSDRDEAGLTLKELVSRYERKVLLETMQKANGVRKEAARRLGIDPRNFNYFLKKHGIE